MPLARAIEWLRGPRLTDTGNINGLPLEDGAWLALNVSMGQGHDDRQTATALIARGDEPTPQTPSARGGPAELARG